MKFKWPKIHEDACLWRVPYLSITVMQSVWLVILILCAATESCQTKERINVEHIKIAPIGISDMPRDTLYISTNNIDLIKERQLNYQIVTDMKTLSAMVSFMKRDEYKNASAARDFNEYGCFNIAGYRNDSLLISYDLNRSDSRKYLKSLVDRLVADNKDVNVIKALKERCLKSIDY